MHSLKYYTSRFLDQLIIKNEKNTKKIKFNSSKKSCLIFYLELIKKVILIREIKLKKTQFQFIF